MASGRLSRAARTAAAVPLDLRILIDLAKYRSGLQFQEMATELGVAKARISEWRSGRSEIGTDEVAYFADKAGLPIIETVIALRPQWAHVWKLAAKSLKAS